MTLKDKIQAISNMKTALAAAQAAEDAAVAALLTSADASDESLAVNDAVAFVPTGTIYANVAGTLTLLNLRGISES